MPRCAETRNEAIHICHVASALKGGSEIMVSQLVSAQLKAGHRVTLIYSPVRDKLENFRHLFPEGVDFVPWAVGRAIEIGSDFRAYKRIKEILSNLDPAIVHLHNAKAGAFGRIACRQIGIPCIYTPHGLPFLRKDMSRWKRSLHFMAEWFLALFGGYVVALSQGEFNAIKSMPCRKVLINNGIDVGSIQAAAQLAPVERSKPFRVVLSGRIETPKNPFFVARLATLSPKNWEWVWIGEGALDFALNESGRFTITGWVPRERALSLVRSADAFLQASLWEGMSFALLEAMALGRLCIVSNVVGNRDLIINGVTGYVCESESDYLAALEKVASSPVEAAKIGASALQYVSRNFDLEAVNDNWRKLYATLLTEGLK